MWLPSFNGLKTRYQQLAQGEDATISSTNVGGISSREKLTVDAVRDVFLRHGGRTKAFFIGLFLFLVLVLSWSIAASFQTTTTAKDSTSLTHRALYLHLIITAPIKSLPLCRLLVSAASNQYPVAQLTSWGTLPNTTDTPRTSPTQGILDFLATFGPERDSDIIIIPSSPNTIFQLRPDVLLERYFELTRLGNQRIRAQLGEYGFKNEEAVRQKIFFAAGKHCSGHVDDAACYAIPESPLPANIYGSTTDTKEAGGEMYTRPRYLDSQFIMGELAAIRALYIRLDTLLQETKGEARETEQVILSKLFGEQEYYREFLQRKHETSTWWKKFLAFFGVEDANRVMNPHPTHNKINVEGAKTTPLEFGIGLDYEGLLSGETYGGNEKGMSGWVVHNSASPLGMEKVRKESDITVSSPEKGASLPEDVKRSLPPFWSRMAQTDGFPVKLGWADIPLLTNLWTGAIPASIHPSSAPSTPKEETEKAANANWKSIWFQPFARKKMDDFSTLPDRYFARLRGNGEEVAWWSLVKARWKLRWVRKWEEGEEVVEWVQWGEICDGFEGKVFGDGGPEWRSKVFEEE